MVERSRFSDLVYTIILLATAGVIAWAISVAIGSTDAEQVKMLIAAGGGTAATVLIFVIALRFKPS